LSSQTQHSQMEFETSDDAQHWQKLTGIDTANATCFSKSARGHMDMSIGQHKRENLHGEDVANSVGGDFETHEWSFRSAPAVCSLPEKAVSVKEAAAFTGGPRAVQGVDAWLSCASSAGEAPPADLFDLGVTDQVSSSARNLRRSVSGGDDACCTRSTVSCSGFTSNSTAFSDTPWHECLQGHCADETQNGWKCPHTNKEILDPVRRSPVHYRYGVLSNSPVSAIRPAAPGAEDWFMRSNMRSSQGSNSSSSRGDFTKSRRLAKRLKQGKTVTM